MRKLKADKIFDGFIFRKDSVLIIQEDGTVEDLVSEADAGSGIENIRGILSPGFINCHCHLELSHMKGLIPKKTGLVKFVTDVIQQRHFPENEILEAIAKAEDEMINNGIVAVGDICNNVLTLPQKAKRRIWYHNFIEASGFHPGIAAARFERSLAIYREYAKNYLSAENPVSIVPHAPYSVAEELWQLIVNFQGNQLLTIHNQETPEENEWFIQKTGAFSNLYENLKINVDFFEPSGTSSLQTYLPRFLNTQSVILVHNVHTTEKDLQFAQSDLVRAKLFWCFCVNANQYITGDLPNLDLFLNNQADIVLGTDSLASNDQLSIAAEIKTIQRSFPHIGLEELLKWATSNGAKALQLDGILGSFERGKKPGVIQIDQSLNLIQRLA